MKNTLSIVRATQPIQKLLLIMKLTWILTIFCVFNSMANVNGQTITLKMQDAEISKVLTTIEKQGSFRFLYNSRLKDLRQKVNVSFSEAEIADVLVTLFTGTQLTYKKLDNNLIAIRSENPEEADIRVTGKVTGTSGEPLSGASVSVKGTTRGTTTDNNGDFAITAPDNATLVISAVGYTPQEIAVSGRNVINASLSAANRVMDEVVVIGYGTASKRDLTGSIAKVQGKEIADKPNPNPLASLQGKVAGVSIVQNGKPGTDPDIRIRGTISRFQTKPLYVVDGLFNDNINFVNPADIESMEILKDPSSLAIFGVRGANGVIIITTKRSKTGQLSVNVSSTIGVKHIVDRPKLTNAANFKTLFDEQNVNQGIAPFPFYAQFTGNTDWISAVSRDAIISTNSVSINGGTDKNKFYMGLGYIRDEGLMKNESLDKILLSINDEFKVSKALKFGFNFNGYRATLPDIPDASRSFSSAVSATPIVEPFNQAKGVYNKLPNAMGGPQITNPLMVVEALANTDLQHEYRAIGSVFGEVTFLRDFTFRATYYTDLGFNDERRYTPLLNIFEGETQTITPQSGYTSTKVYQKQNTYKKFQQDYLLTFKKNFGDHGLTAIGGFTTYYNSYSEMNGQVSQPANGPPIPNDKRFWYVDNFFGDPTTKISQLTATTDLFGNPLLPLPLQWEQTTVSFLARALYNYKGKYMLNASFRRDGSSEISPDHRYQNFVAIGAAWEMTKEDFMSSQKVFDFLKVKGSWGILGNQYVDLHYPFYPQLRTGDVGIFGNNVIPAFVTSYLVDSNLQWETVRSVEAGFEFATLKNRLSVEFNYYNKLTDHLLAVYPGISGSKPGLTNFGKIENKGIELTLRWNDRISKDFNYMVSANITTIKNTVKELDAKNIEIFSGPNRTAIGDPIASFYGYIVDGVYQNQADTAKSAKAYSFGSYGPGDLKYRDLNGDGQITVADRTVIGNPTPKLLYGISLGASWKGFDFGLDLQGVSGNDIYRNWGNGFSFARMNYREAQVGRWHGDGTSNWEPELNDNRSINNQNSTYRIEDGSYLRIRNLQLGYNFSTASLSKAHIKSLRIFVNGQNLKTFKHTSGFTPEAGGTALSFGVDGGTYPIPAIYTAGINLTF